MVFAAEWGVGQVFWSLIWFFLFVMWIMTVISVFADVIRSDDLSGVAKALWATALIFVPFLGVIVYLIARGDGMGRRNLEQAKAQEAAVRDYIRDVGAPSSIGDELAKLADLHEAGRLTDAEYEAAKSRLINA